MKTLFLLVFGSQLCQFILFWCYSNLWLHVKVVEIRWRRDRPFHRGNCSISWSTGRSISVLEKVCWSQVVGPIISLQVMTWSIEIRQRRIIRSDFGGNIFSNIKDSTLLTCSIRSSMFLNSKPQSLSFGVKTFITEATISLLLAPLAIAEASAFLIVRAAVLSESNLLLSGSLK